MFRPPSPDALARFANMGDCFGWRPLLLRCGLFSFAQSLQGTGNDLLGRAIAATPKMGRNELLTTSIECQRKGHLYIMVANSPKSFPPAAAPGR